MRRQSGEIYVDRERHGKLTGTHNCSPGKQSQQKAASRDQERQRKPGAGQSRDGFSQRHHNENAMTPRPANRLVTPSQSSDDTDTMLSPDILLLPFGATPEPGLGERSADPGGTTTNTSLASALAMGMGGLLGEQPVMDFTDLGSFSPPPSTFDAYPTVGSIVSGSRRVSLGASEEDPLDELNMTVHDVPEHHYQPVFGHQHRGEQTATQAPAHLRRGSPPVPTFSAASRSRVDIPKNSGLPAQNPPPPPRCRPPRSPLPGRDPDRGWLGPLHLAASRGHDRIVRMLLKRHRSVDEPDSDGLTALMHAVQGGFEDVTGSLLDAGAAVDDVDRHGRTAMHWAVLRRRETLLRQLLEQGAAAGANLDVYDEAGRTPLHYAIDGGFEAGVQVLLEFDVDLRCKARKST